MARNPSALHRVKEPWLSGKDAGRAGRPSRLDPSSSEDQVGQRQQAGRADHGKPRRPCGLRPVQFSAGRRLGSTSAHVRNPRSTAATDITVALRAGDRSRHRRDFDAITVLLVRRTGRCRAILRCPTPKPGYQPGSRSCFHAAIASFLWCRPISRPGTHHLTARPNAVRRHQQSASQPQSRFCGLWMRCRTLRAT
jgi:hypothetical protein